MRLVLILAAVLVGLVGCNSDPGATFTLYRNSPADRFMRIHWASFNATESGSYNMSNCFMAMRMLNANMDALASKDGEDRNPLIGFWCEPGPYKAKGSVPHMFMSAYPTDAQSTF